MVEYVLEAVEDLVFRELEFTREQIGFVGKCLSTKTDQRVKKVEIVWSNSEGSFGKILKRHKDGPTTIMQIGLDGKLGEQHTDEVLGQLREMLSSRGIDSSRLYSYCSHSYGLQTGPPLNMDVHLYLANPKRT
ncbi:MAG: hypothetical protein AABX10_02875 [Nanoarchaeota archaeon]